jgi:hypothetical protein
MPAVPPDRAQLAASWPFDRLIMVLVRQFRALLLERRVALSDSDIELLAHQIENRAEPDEQAQAVRAALIEIVSDSENVLAQWNLSFQQAMTTEMGDLPGWESTSDFLEVATEKANAELRIAAAAALVALLGDQRYAAYLAFLAHGNFDVDSVIARRVLAFLDGANPT